MEEGIEQDIIGMIYRMIDIQDRHIIHQIQEGRIQEHQMKPSTYQDIEDRQHIKIVFHNFLNMRIRPKAIKHTMREREIKDWMIILEVHLHHQDQRQDR